VIRTIGVIGAGDHMRQILLPAAIAAGLRPRVVAARTQASAQAAAYPYGAEVVSGAADVASADVDAVVVAVPVDQVASVLRKVIPAGKPVYVEKPGAATSAQASELAALADRYGTRLQVGYMKRYAPAYQRLRRAIADGDLGPLTLASIRWAMGPFGGRRGLTDWLVENAVHAFDLAGYLVGPLRIADVLVREIHGEHVVLVQGDCGDNGCFTMHACTTGPWWHDNETVEVLGIGASISARNVTELALRRGDDPAQVWSPNFSIPVARNLTGTLLGFVPAVAAFAAPDHHENPGPDMHQAAAVLGLVEQVAAAAGAA
jgi:predicted dehydrogenase